MKKVQILLTILLVAALLFVLPVSAQTVSESDLGSLSGNTVITWDEFYHNVTATTGTDKGVLTRVTGAEGEFETYLQYEVQGITTAAENSRTLTYKDTENLGMAGYIKAGDVMMLRMIIRSVGQEGKTKATALEAGVGTTSKPTGTITIPTDWTEIYVPMEGGGIANMFTLRFGYFNQTVQIADLTLVNYGTAVSKADLPTVSRTAAPAKAGIAKGGTAVTTDMFPETLSLITGETLFIDPITAVEDDMVLLTLPVRAKAVCSTITVSGSNVNMTYKVPVQWSNIYVPFISDGSLSDLTVSVDNGAVEFGTVTLENKGSATFEDLALKSGIWLLEDYEQIILPESAGVKPKNEAFYASAGISSGRTADLVLSSNGRYVYSIGDGMLTVTDVQDANNPVVMSKLTDMGDVAGTSSLGDTRQICLLPGKGTNGGDAVIFTCRSYGAFIFDMADPANPVELAHYDALEMATGLAVYGDYAFVCSRFYGVEVVDLSDPAKPTHLCTILNEGGEVQSCKVVDGILYAGEYNKNCVSIYDVTDPLCYKKLGVCSLNGRGDGMAVATVNGRTYLYAGTGHHAVSGLANSTPLSNLYYGQGNGLDIFDVTDPANPVWMSTSKIDGRFYNTSCDFWSAEYAYDAATGRSYAYLVSTFNGLYVFDVTDPKAPIRVAHVALELLPDSPNYGAYGLTGSRAFIYNFDTTGTNPTKYGAVGAVAVEKGVLYIGGVLSDLYVYPAAFAFDQEGVSENVEVAVNGDYYSFDAFKDLEGFASAVVEGGQTYAVDTLGDYVYVAAGAKGIVIYNKDLEVQKTIATEDICYDLYIQDGKLYTAQGRAGVIVYTLEGLNLTETWRHKSTVGQVTMARPTSTGKFVLLHVGAVTGQIVRVSDHETLVSAKASSQMYHHNITQVVAGRYMGFWANSSAERWYDFGENDSFDKPVRVTDASSGYTPRAAQHGGIVAYGNQALAMGNGGYVLYDPNTITASEMAALTFIKPVDGYGSEDVVNIYGKPTIAGNIMVSCDRIYSRIYITSIADVNNPVLLASFVKGVGNPDIAKVDGNTVYIPLGYMGIVKFDLRQFEPAGDIHMGGDHCVCAGNVKDHDCDSITWQPWGATDEEKTSLPASGNYYLVDDLTVTEKQVKTGTLNLCLNGHTVSAKGTARVVSARTGGKVNITDCRGSGELLGAAGNGSGGVAYLDDNSESQLSVYGGTLRATQTTVKHGGVIYSAGGTVNIHGGAIRDGSVTEDGTTARYGGNIYMSKGLLNITGGIIDGGSTTGENGGNIYTAAGVTVSISGGIISNGSATKRGCNIYLNSSKTAPSTIQMTGGTVMFDKNLTSTGLGGNIYVSTAGQFNMSGGTVKDGISGSGGNIYINVLGKLTMTGGTIEGGYASSYGGNVCINAAASMEMSDGTIRNGEAKSRGGNVCLLYNEEFAETYGSDHATLTMTGGKLLDGVSKGNGGNLFVYNGCVATLSGDAVVSGGNANSHGGNICGNNSGTSYSKIYIYGGDAVSGGTADAEANGAGDGDNIYATGYLYIDLMGKDLQGVHCALTRGYFWDSATNSYDGSKAGKLTLADSVSGTLRTHWKDTETLKRYLTIENEDGSYEFHRFYIGITHMNLKPGVTGVGYKATVAGSDEVLARIENYGYKFWITEDKVAVGTKAGTELTNRTVVTARIQNFDVENYGETPINGCVFLNLKDGTVIESSVGYFTLRQLIEKINGDVEGYTQVQLSALKAMCEKYADAMTDWNINNIISIAA